MRPQFGSPPKTAVLTSIEFPIRRAARSASFAERAPRTSTRRSFVAPSPSRASCRTRSSHTDWSATSNCFASREPARSAVRIERPLAKNITESEVDVSPSTESRLKVASVTRRSIARSRTGEIFASVARKQSIVAMLGSIMPAPLAIPWSVTFSPPSANRAEATLAKVSVVRIASAASAKPSGERAETACGIPRFKTSRGSGWPMTPVEASNTSFSSQPIARAA